MIVDITIDPKSLDAKLTYQIEHFKDQKALKDALATVMMVAGDYSLDPELDLEDLEAIVNKAKEEKAKALIFVVNESEIEAEFAN